MLSLFYPSIHRTSSALRSAPLCPLPRVPWYNGISLATREKRKTISRQVRSPRQHANASPQKVSRRSCRAWQQSSLILNLQPECVRAAPIANTQAVEKYETMTAKKVSDSKLLGRKNRRSTRNFGLIREVLSDGRTALSTTGEGVRPTNQFLFRFVCVLRPRAVQAHVRPSVRPRQPPLSKSKESALHVPDNLISHMEGKGDQGRDSMES